MISTLIASTLCLQLNTLPDASKYYTSCINASQAVSIQYKVSPTLDAFEQRMQNEVKKKTGETIWWGIGLIYSYQQKGTVNFNLPFKPYIDNINLSGNPSGSGNIGFTWYF